MGKLQSKTVVSLLSVVILALRAVRYGHGESQISFCWWLVI